MRHSSSFAPCAVTVDAHLAKALVEIAIFLEFPEDQKLDDEAATAASQRLGLNLAKMEPSARAALAAAIRPWSGRYPEHADFVWELPELLGLV